jgi:hypothetical protein
MFYNRASSARAEFAIFRPIGANDVPLTVELNLPSLFLSVLIMCPKRKSNYYDSSRKRNLVFLGDEIFVDLSKFLRRK